jgi:acyl-CoA dehydrogenase
MARYTGAYARVRSQFKTPIGKLEGVEDALGRIGANAYMMDAARIMTAGAVDAGEKPSVISAIMKLHMTERVRKVIDDAMDIHGGKGICLGPNNWVGRGYQVVPVGITVEGANILTRSLIVFGQGAIRCHPYVLREMLAAKDEDRKAASIEFDKALSGHIVHTASNKLRAFFHALTGSAFASAPELCAPETVRYYKDLSRISAAFAFLADVSMLVLGGSLKRKEKISGRLGDALSMLYLGSATLKRFEDTGRPQQDLPFVHYAMQDILYQAQQALDGVIANFPSRIVAAGLRVVLFPLGKRFSPPSDDLNHQCASLLLSPSAARDRLTKGMYLSTSEADPTGQLEAAFLATIACEPIENKLRKALKKGKLVRRMQEDIATLALDQGVITAEEFSVWQRKETLRKGVIKVDDFPQDFGRADLSARQDDKQADAVQGEGKPSIARAA